MPSIKLSDDLLTGAGQIAEFTGWPVRKVYYEVAQNRLPAFRVGETICARKSEIATALSSAARAEPAHAAAG